MAWEPDDIRRSLQRYVAMMLEDPWTVRAERREVKDEERPVAVIQLGPQTSTRARRSLEQGNVESLMPVTVSCYPAIPAGDDVVDNVRESRVSADEIRGLMIGLLEFGLVVQDEDGKNWAGPYAIPLWDWTGVPVTGDDREGPKKTPSDPAGSAPPHDVLWVIRESVVVEGIQDPEDALRWTVAATFRITVEAPGRTDAPDPAVPVGSIPGTFLPPPG